MPAIAKCTIVDHRTGRVIANKGDTLIGARLHQYRTAIADAQANLAKASAAHREHGKGWRREIRWWKKIVDKLEQAV